jgi:4'-phosphopantetheinyl transferase
MTAAGLPLASRQVDLWIARTDVDARTCEKWLGVLDAQERGRASSLVFEADRRRYIASHAFARRVLGGYRAQAPHGLSFRRGPYGKPGLDGGPEFNLSHAGVLALLAVGGSRAVGVDVERVRPFDDALALASRYFCRAEQEALRRLDPEALTLGFYLCWTRKEAFIKATGEGLSSPLDGFEVTCTPGEPARLRVDAGPHGEKAGWSLRHLDPMLGYVGALAAPGPIEKVRTRRMAWA